METTVMPNQQHEASPTEGTLMQLPLPLPLPSNVEDHVKTQVNVSNEGNKRKPNANNQRKQLKTTETKKKPERKPIRRAKAKPQENGKTNVIPKSPSGMPTQNANEERLASAENQMANSDMKSLTAASIEEQGMISKAAMDEILTNFAMAEAEAQGKKHATTCRDSKQTETETETCPSKKRKAPAPKVRKIIPKQVVPGLEVEIETLDDPQPAVNARKRKAPAPRVRKIISKQVVPGLEVEIETLDDPKPAVKARKRKAPAPKVRKIISKQVVPGLEVEIETLDDPKPAVKARRRKAPAPKIRKISPEQVVKVLDVEIETLDDPQPAVNEQELDDRDEDEDNAGIAIAMPSSEDIWQSYLDVKEGRINQTEANWPISLMCDQSSEQRLEESCIYLKKRVPQRKVPVYDYNEGNLAARELLKWQMNYQKKPPPEPPEDADPSCDEADDSDNDVEQNNLMEEDADLKEWIQSELLNEPLTDIEEFDMLLSMGQDDTNYDTLYKLLKPRGLVPEVKSPEPTENDDEDNSQETSCSSEESKSEEESSPEMTELSDEQQEEVPNEEACQEDPIEELIEEPLEEPIEEPIEESIKQTIEEPVEKPNELFIKQPIEETMEAPIELLIQQPIEKTMEAPIELLIQQPIEKTMEAPIEDLIQQPMEKIMEAPIEDLIGEIIEESIEDPIEVSIEDPNEERVEKIAEETANETPLKDIHAEVEMPEAKETQDWPIPQVQVSQEPVVHQEEQIQTIPEDDMDFASFIDLINDKVVPDDAIKSTLQQLESELMINNDDDKELENEMEEELPELPLILDIQDLAMLPPKPMDETAHQEWLQECSQKITEQLQQIAFSVAGATPKPPEPAVAKPQGIDYEMEISKEQLKPSISVSPKRPVNHTGWQNKFVEMLDDFEDDVLQNMTEFRDPQAKRLRSKWYAQCSKTVQDLRRTLVLPALPHPASERLQKIRILRRPPKRSEPFRMSIEMKYVRTFCTVQTKRQMKLMSLLSVLDNSIYCPEIDVLQKRSESAQLAWLWRDGTVMIINGRSKKMLAETQKDLMSRILGVKKTSCPQHCENVTYLRLTFHAQFPWKIDLSDFNRALILSPEPIQGANSRYAYYVNKDFPGVAARVFESGAIAVYAMSPAEADQMFECLYMTSSKYRKAEAANLANESIR